VSDAPQCAS